MLVRELFENFHYEEDLFENLGTLNVIDKKFLNLFKTSGHVNYDKGLDTTLEKGLVKNIGAKSPIEITPVKNASQTVKLLTTDKNIFGLVINISGHQVLAALKHSAHGEDTPMYTAAIDIDILKNNLEDHEDILKIIELSKEIKSLSSWTKKYSGKSRIEDLYIKGGIILFECKEGSVDKIISQIIKILKPFGNLEVFTIAADTNRKELSISRPNSRKYNYSDHPVQKAQSGQKITDEDRKHLEQTLKSRLMSKLKDFKLTNLKSVSTPKELIELIKEKGYGDKLKINGQTYQRGANSISIDRLISKEECYVEYSLDWDTPEYEKAKEKFERVRELYTENPNRIKELYKKNMPVQRFRVIIKMEGGIISPSELDITEFGKW